MYQVIVRNTMNVSQIVKENADEAKDAKKKFARVVKTVKSESGLLPEKLSNDAVAFHGRNFAIMVFVVDTEARDVFEAEYAGKLGKTVEEMHQLGVYAQPHCGPDGITWKVNDTSYSPIRRIGTAVQ